MTVHRDRLLLNETNRCTIIFQLFISGNKQTTPNYITVKANGKNLQSQKTINPATRYSLNQELKFLYIKKQKLNEKLYRIHLECATYWQNNWHIIQTSIDNNLQQRMESHYNHLNNKLDHLQEK